MKPTDRLRELAIKLDHITIEERDGGYSVRYGTGSLETVGTWLNELADLIEDKYMELPTDQKGEPIHIGDQVQGQSDGKLWFVSGIGQGAYPIIAGTDGLEMRKRLKPEWIAKPETVADILEELLRIYTDERLEQRQLIAEYYLERIKRAQR